MIFNEIFKVPIGQFNLDLNNKEMTKYCLNYRKKDKGRVEINEGGYLSNDLPIKGNKISNEGGYQSFSLNGIHKPLDDLFYYITESSREFGDKLEFDKSKNLNLSNIWININGYGHSNVSHIHPHSILSGVYYVQTFENCGDIYFNHPCYNTFLFDWKDVQKQPKNCFTAPRWFFKPKPGMLLLFPSWLEHFVQPNLNKNKKERISISFNIV